MLHHICLSDNNVGFCQDTKGVELVRDAILGDWNNKYKTVLEPFLKKMPDKTFHYVASYMLKGYAMEKKGIAEKYRATSYKSLKRKILLLSDILDNAYGKSYCQISNPTLIGNVVNLGIANANKRKSREITHSFGMKLRALMLGKEVEITFCDVQRTKKKYKFTDEERLSFVLFGILYASRCNNFHAAAWKPSGRELHKTPVSAERQGLLWLLPEIDEIPCSQETWPLV